MQRSFGQIAKLSLVMLSIALLGRCAVGQNLVEDRIVQAIENGKMLALPGTVHPQAQARYDQGQIDGATKLQGMSMSFTLTANQQTALTALLKAQQDPSSPSYRKWLTPQQYGERFGMSQSDIGKVSSWLASQGFTVDKVAESNNIIWFSGTAATAEQAFHTSIHKYNVEGEMHFGNAAAVSVPTALGSSVSYVSGLSNFKLKSQILHPVKSNKFGVTPDLTSAATGSHFIQPGDFAVIYDLNPLYTANFTGAGVTIGVIGETDLVQTDVTNFRSAAGLPAYGTAGGPTFTSFLIPTSADPGIQYGELGEAHLDVEWSGGVAPNANIVFVNSTDVLDSLQYAIANQINGLTIPILTMSYGNCEAAFPTADITSLEASFQEANVQGQTFINSSGDSGATACDADSGTTATQGLAVGYPPSSANVTGVGGSSFMGDGTAASPQTGPGTYWLGATGSNDQVTSAKSYIPEMAWNDTAFNIPLGGGLASGGGGVSILFAKPSWQTGVAGIPADSHRDVPDVSLTASADHDGYLYCTEIILDSNAGTGTYTPSCSSGFRISDPGFNDDQNFSIVGGTSASAPSFAGILATIEQKLGTPLGNLNPDLYTLASNATTYASAFHDITTGNNETPCTSGSTGCPSGSNQSIGYVATTGYDQATGLGSVDGENLATALGTLTVETGTTTTLSLLPAAPTVGEAVVFTATITPNTGTGTPTGTVTFTIGGVAGTPVTLANGVATTSTDFSTGGSKTITAAYSGDANNFASKSTSTVTVGTAPTAAPTTTMLSTGGVATVALNQGSLTLTATVTSTTAGTIAGQVEFTVGTAAPVAVPVVSGASGSATASTTIPATAANGFVPGTTNITAAYGGDSDYAASTSAAAAITVTNPTLTMTVANMTIPSSSPGSTGTSAISIASMGGYAGTVNLTANAASLDASYVITPASLAIPVGMTETASISITTISNQIKAGARGNLKHASTSTNDSRVIAGAAAAFGCIFLLGIPAFRKKRWPMLTMILLLGALSAGIGCGGGSSGSSPKGTYTVTVIATDSATPSITVSTNFTVTIQ